MIFACKDIIAMSKPISFGFGKAKAPATVSSSITTSKTSISFPTKTKTPLAKPGFKAARALHADDDDELGDENEPKHEELTGFSSSGAILSKPVEEKKEFVIQNSGNADWAQKVRQKSGLPTARREGRDVVMVEKQEVSTASGLQMAPAGEDDAQKTVVPATNGSVQKPKTADEEALQALLDGDEGGPRGTAVIDAGEDERFGQVNNQEDFQSFVESHPDSSTLEEYAAMPVEEFGLAMLRGMGKKRRANGEIIQLEADKDKKEEKRVKRQEFLGIGAKSAPNMDGVELGAWGKADMRKNNRGAGFFTPLMVRDTKTGETITEEELERRKKEAEKGNGKDKDDWRDRRDRNLDKHGRNGDEKDKSSSRKRRDDDSDYDSSRSRKDRDRDRDDDYDQSRSRRRRSRSRSKERRHRDDDRYDSSSSRRDRDRSRDRDKYRDRHRDRSREGRYESDERKRRHRDR